MCSRRRSPRATGRRPGLPPTPEPAVSIRFRRLKPGDARLAAPFILDAGPHLARLLGGPRQALRAIESCVRAERTMFGHGFGLFAGGASHTSSGIVVAFPGRLWGSLRLGTGVLLARSAGVTYGLDLMRRGIVLDRLHPWVPSSSLYVSALAVDGGYRKQGIGQALMERAVAGAAGLGLGITLDVDLDNQPAIRLYEKMGFRTLDERRAEPEQMALIGSPGFARMMLSRP